MRLHLSWGASYVESSAAHWTCEQTQRFMSADNKCIFIQEICHILLMRDTKSMVCGSGTFCVWPVSIQSHRDRGFGVSQTHMGSLFSFDVAALISACEKPASDDMCEGSHVRVQF